MDAVGTLTNGQNAALLYAFLQADCGHSDYYKELLSVGKELNLVGDMRSNLESGDLEPDGYVAYNLGASLGDLQPSVELQLPMFQEVAEGLREIAAHLERDLVAQSIQNLNSRITAYPSDQWKHHLASVVETAMRQGVGPKDLPQERVIMALTLTLVRGVCKQAPRLLRSLFAATLQYISRPSVR